MKNLSIQIKKNNIFSFFFFLAALFFSVKSTVLAQNVSINAVVPDFVPPSAPILIEPSDGALLSDSTPSFKWYESTDNISMSHYVFYKDGSILFNNIPLVATDNSYYVLAYDALNGIYTLTPKNVLSDGAHTWKITAVDYANLSTSSDTWDFTIDTLVPSFVLKKIGDVDVSISAANVGSVPSDPIIIFGSDATANEPTLIAIGEANSSVKLTVTIPDDPLQTFTTSIDGNGNYSLKLGILPRDTDIRLDFIITDGASHVSVLEKVYIRIALQYWPTATLTSTPTPSASATNSQSPSPSSTKTISPSFTTKPSTTLTITLTPTTTVAPTGIIPIIPPREIIHEVGDELVEAMPESTASYIRTFLTSRLWQQLSLLFALLIIVIFYLTSFLILISKFASTLSWSLVKKIMVLLFPTFFKAQKNLVFEHRDTLASPLAKVILVGESDQVLDFSITNLDGNFDDFNYPADEKWRLKVDDPNFYYPIGDEKPSQLEFWQFYQNQLMGDGYYGQAILIPTLRAAGQDKLPFFERLRIFVLYLLDYPFWFLIIFWLFSLIFALRYPSIYNNLALALHSFMLLFRIYSLFKNNKKLIVDAKFSDGQQFSDNLVLSFFDQNSQTSLSMVAPFEFSKSKQIEHSFKKISLTAFSKNFALEKNNVVVGNQEIILEEKAEEISIQIVRVLD